MVHCRLSDRTALLTLLGMCLVLKVIVLARQPILARDGIHYIQFARELTQHSLSGWVQTIQRQPYHPGYPAIVAGVATAFQSFQEGILSPTEWQWCAHVASSLAGVLLVLPLYALARCYLTESVALLASLLFLILPATVQITTDALAESWLLLFLLSALWSLARGLRELRSIWFALAGAFAGCGYLVRLEALVIPASALLMFITHRWWAGYCMPWPRTLRGGLLLGASFLVVAAPYMLAIGKISNRPSVNQLVHAVLDAARGSGARDSQACFAERRQDGVNGHHLESVRFWEAVSLVVRSHGRAGHYFLWPLAAVGAIVLWRRRRGDPAIGLLGCVAIVHVVMLLRLAYSAGYTSERHTLLLVALAAVTASAGLTALVEALTDWTQRTWASSALIPGGIVLALLGLCLPRALQPLHASQEAHRRAGFWLASHGYAHRPLVDPYLWASFYAGNVTSPSSSQTPGLPVIGIVDPRDEDLNRIRDWQQAGLLAAGSIQLWCWPLSGPTKLEIRASTPAATTTVLK